MVCQRKTNQHCANKIGNSDFYKQYSEEEKVSLQAKSKTEESKYSAPPWEHQGNMKSQSVNSNPRFLIYQIQ